MSFSLSFNNLLLKGLQESPENKMRDDCIARTAFLGLGLSPLGIRVLSDGITASAGPGGSACYQCVRGMYVWRVGDVINALVMVADFRVCVLGHLKSDLS